ncbi:MAG: Mov34/MPN/PAD-1 family protein [Sphingomonas taxi]
MAEAPCPPRVDTAAAAALLLAGLADAAVERAAVLYLDPEWRLLGRSDFVGQADTVAPPLRAVIAEALRLDAAALVLGHSHPSGDPAPSAADVAYTRALGRVAAAVDLMLADHLIVADGRITSLREGGWM